MVNFDKLITEPVLDFEKYQEDFVWDIFFHIPVPTSKFIANKLGIDFISFAGSEAQANRMLTTLAKTAKDFAFGSLPQHSREVATYLLARSKDLIDNFIEYECAFIIAATTVGSVYELYNITKGDNRPYIAGLESAAKELITKIRMNKYLEVPADLIGVGY